MLSTYKPDKDLIPLPFRRTMFVRTYPENHYTCMTLNSKVRTGTTFLFRVKSTLKYTSVEPIRVPQPPGTPIQGLTPSSIPETLP